jgi:flagellar hook-basal body complex protein FliE
MQPINYNPMENFNSVFSSQMNQINDETSMLKGGIETTIMPEMLKTDPQLKNDLNILSNEGAGKVANDFKSALSNSLNELNSTQRNAENAVETFATGGDIDVHSVMIASQKASLSMSMALQLRNKAIQAYQEIYKMGV